MKNILSRSLAAAVIAGALFACDMPGAAPPKPAAKSGATAAPKTTDLTQRQREVMDSAKQVQSVVDQSEEARRKQLDAAESK